MVAELKHIQKAMIIYNVTIKVEPAIADEWVQWMKNEHIADVLATGMFTDCRLSKLLEQDETDGITFSAQYFANSIDEYNRYIDEFAPAMREKGHSRFGPRFIAFRSVMEVIH